MTRSSEQRARRVLRAAARAARRVGDLVPVTPLGAMVLGGATLALEHLAYPELDLVWLVIGYGAVGLVGAAVLAVSLGALWVKLATRAPAHGDVERRTLVTDRSLPTGFTGPSLRALPLVQVLWAWEDPKDAEITLERRGGRLRERVTLRTRGRVRGIRRRLVVQDAFGLARVAVRQRDPEELTVVPNPGRLGDQPMLVSLAGGDERPHPMGIDDGDRVELRRYVPGDPARFIHWKVFGRTRRLMVRVPERALSPSRRTVAYQIAGPGDEATAAAARVAVSAGIFGPDWSFSADGARGDTDRPDEALEMIVRSVEARERGGAGLDPFLRRAEQTGPASAVIFAPARPGPWLAHAVRAARPRAPRTRFVVTTDGVDALPPPPWWRSLLTLPTRREGTPSRELDEVVRTLAETRAEVIVLDRKTGRRLGDRHRAAMRRLEGREAA